MDIGGFGFMDRMFPIFFSVIFLLVIGVFVFTIGSSVTRWRKNNASPKLTVPARVVSKRQDYSRGMRTNNGVHSGWTRYYATFEVESGDRMELSLAGEEYGLLAEGDVGSLSFQGQRFLSFTRA